MWQVTIRSTNMFMMPPEILGGINEKIDYYSTLGFTSPGPSIFTEIDLTWDERKRNFTTQEVAQEYVDYLNTLPADYVQVISLEEVTV